MPPAAFTSSKAAFAPAVTWRPDEAIGPLSGDQAPIWMSPLLDDPDDDADPQAARVSVATQAHAVPMISRFMTDSKFGMNSVQETVARCDVRDKTEFR